MMQFQGLFSAVILSLLLMVHHPVHQAQPVSAVSMPVAGSQGVGQAKAFGKSQQVSMAGQVVSVFPDPGTGTDAQDQGTNKVAVQWISLAQLQEQMARKPKPILVDLYTDWCGWCKVMDKKTYARTEVAQYINTHFYAVKINAESREAMTFQGKTYQFNSQAKIHNLAIQLTRGQLSFPHTIFVMPGDPQPQAIPGYLEVPDMELLLKYFGEGRYGKEDFSAYQKKFSPSWK